MRLDTQSGISCHICRQQFLFMSQLPLRATYLVHLNFLNLITPILVAERWKT
jgi:hypothetical protein